MRITIGLCCSLLLMAGIAARNRATKDLDVQFRFQESVLTLHEPVVVLFEVHNGTTKPVVVTVGATVRQFFDFSLETPSGDILHKDPFDGQVDIVTYGDGKVTVNPGANYTESLVMNRWFPFESQGAYSLTSKLTSNIETADGNVEAVTRTAQLLINPRDPAKLTKVCGDLAQQAELAASVQVAQFPALALSYVNDPIAIPYLARLLSAHTLAYASAITGLERIGDDGAAEVLLSALNENWGDTSELATRSLAWMQDRISNPRLKDTVKKAVERSSERARSEFIKEQIAYLDYRSPQLQNAAIQSLMRVENGLQQAEPILQRLANDPNQSSDVKASAKEALEKLHPKKEP
jgi:hypothetical protein